jgi:type II secretion system protein I
MLKIKRILSKKGFSLIELMVALAILGIAALGIFQAYTTGFQAMADSKDRTVATNIAQKKLEEVKNSVKVTYPYYSIGYQELNGKTFTIIVATNLVEENLEQVIVTVSWKNRNEIEKNVQLETLVYDLKIEYNVPGPDVGRIALSADPLEITCCVVGETSTITAELFDTSDPEQRVPSGTPVSFSINNGNINPEFAVTDPIGKAYTDLTINGLGPATVRASSGGVYSDFLQVTCTPEAGKIDLSANPSSILPGNTSTITAKVTDTCGSVISEEVTVEFNTDKGTFENGLTTITTGTTNGEANVTLSSVVNGDTATVTGTVTPVPAEGDPISGSTTVLCTDYSISVTANPTSINPGGDNNTSTITAILTQSGGSIPIGETISFTTDKGTLSAPTAITDSWGKAIISLSSLVGGDIATITATYNILGNGSISDNTTVKCTEYIINIVAEPNKIIPGGQSTITATLTNYLGAPASNRRVDFYTTEGVLNDTSMYTNSSGTATTTLTLNNVGEVANVSVTFGYTSDSVTVECIEFILTLTAVPTSIIPGESSEITALLTNYSGIPQSNKTINFTTDNGSFTETGGTTATANTNASGKAIVHLTLNTGGTTAVITATYGGVEATVSVECSETYITLNSPPNISFWTYYPYSSNYSIRFDLFLHGGPLVIDKVKIEWETSYGSPSRYLNMWIEIPPGSTSNRTRIFSGNFSNNNIIVTLNQNSPYTILANRSFRILINFNALIRNRDIVFTLNPDDPHAAENYQVEFTTPNY